MNDRIKVLLDNGHGIDTAGKRSPDGKLREYDWNRKTANVTLSILKERGVDVELVVPEITDIPLSERSLRANAIAKAFGASNVVYVSVHVNAAGNSHQWMKARGWSVFVYNKPSSKAVMLASSLFDKAAEKGFRMRKPEALKKYWNANFAVLRQTVCPASWSNISSWTTVMIAHIFLRKNPCVNARKSLRMELFNTSTIFEMKRLILMMSLCLMVTGCGTSCRLSKCMTESVRDSIHVETSKTDETETFTDTSKTESGKVTITEIEFFPPASGGDSLGNHALVIPATDINLLDIGSVANAGAVKSIRQTVIESETVQKGESRKAEESEESKKGTSVAVKTDESVVEKVIEAPKSNRVKYIFYLALLAVVVLAYIKRVPILNTIRKILAGLKKLLV